MFDLGAAFALGKRHIEGNAGNNGLPSFIFGKAASFDRTPEIDNLFFGDAFRRDPDRVRDSSEAISFGTHHDQYL